jgi:hypothetical protein
MSAQADVQLKDFSTIFSLEGKVAVVTGGSRGLGLHAASGYVTFGSIPKASRPLSLMTGPNRFEHLLAQPSPPS